MPDGALIRSAPPQLPYHIPIHLHSINLPLTFDNGQVFHWRFHSDTGIWEGVIDVTACRIFQNESGLWTDADPVLVADYLALDDPLEKIEASFPRNAYCKSALAACRGMRIIRQPFWECLASFICSSMKQVKHIRQVTTELRKRYGNRVCDSALFSFPSAEVLAQVSEKELRECQLGFRAKGLKETACRVAGGMCEEEELRRVSTDEARVRLTQLPGVGPKIANCVLLFSLHRLEAVPVDVWINRILVGLAGRKLTAKQLRARAKQLGPFAGYVQQYLFHHARVGGVLPPVVSQ